MTGLKGMIVVMAIPKEEGAQVRARILPIAEAAEFARKAVATGRYAEVIEAVPFRSTSA